MRTWRSSQLRAETGSVTAEFATLVPAVLLVLACCLGAVQIVAQYVRLTDAAADGARSLARGDGTDRAAARVHQSVGPVGWATGQEGEFVCLRLSSPAAFGPVGAVGVTITARSCALSGGR